MEDNDRFYEAYSDLDAVQLSNLTSPSNVRAFINNNGLVTTSDMTQIRRECVDSINTVRTLVDELQGSVTRNVDWLSGRIAKTDARLHQNTTDVQRLGSTVGLLSTRAAKVDVTLNNHLNPKQHLEQQRRAMDRLKDFDVPLIHQIHDRTKIRNNTIPGALSRL